MSRIGIRLGKLAASGAWLLFATTALTGQGPVPSAGAAPAQSSTPETLPEEQSAAIRWALDRYRALVPDAPEPRSTGTARIMPSETMALEADLAEQEEAGGDPVSADQRRRAVFFAALQQLENSGDGRADDHALVRQAVQAGFPVIWAMLDNREAREATRLLARLEAQVDRFAQPALPPSLYLSMARILWLKSRYFGETAESELSLRMNTALLALTQDPSVYPADQNRLRIIRVNALFATRGERRDPALAEACALVEDILRADNGESGLSGVIQCARHAAIAARTPEAMAAAEAQALRAASLVEAQAARRAGTGGRWSTAALLRRGQIDLILASLMLRRRNEPERVRLILSAADRFVEALEGRAYFQNSSNELFTYYSQLNIISLNVSGVDGTARAQVEPIALFERLYAALAATRRAFPQAPALALIQADAAARVANYHRDAGDIPRADEARERALAAFDVGRPAENLVLFDEMVASECSFRNLRVRRLVTPRQVDPALTAYRRLEQACAPWLDRFPYDYLSRSSLLSGGAMVGRLLHQSHRYEEARPLLQRASDWGDKDSSIYLADIYRYGRGVAIDPARAGALAALGSRQSMKRFTIPVSFNGTRHPFHVYISEFAAGHLCAPLAEPGNAGCIGFLGIDDQVAWLREERGGEVPQDVIASFRTLHTMARNRGESFPDLVARAIGEAARNQAPAAPAQAAPAPTAPLDLRGGRLFAVDRSGPTPTAVETFVIPHRSGASCFEWRLRATPQPGAVELTEILVRPAGAAPWPTGPGREPTQFAGQRATTPVSESASDGLLAGGRCLAAADPPGIYTLTVMQGDRNVFQTEFELLVAPARRGR